MLLILIAGLALLGLAVVMVAKAAALGRSGPQGLQSVRGYGFRTPAADDDGNSGGAAVQSLADRVGAVAERSTSFGRGLRQKLIAAGMYETPATRFMGYQILLAIGLPVVWIVFSSSVGVNGGASVVGLLFAVILGILGPSYYLNRRVRLRQASLDRDLPELIDLLVVTIEAGVGFAGALRIAAERLSGSLAEELRLTLQEQNMGLTTSEALKNLGDRCPTPGIRIFVRSIAQGETLGVSIGQIMRNVALEMRKRRRALAEERAQKAPVKMLFPLIFLIFPSMFVVLLLPAIIAFFRALSG